ncbi:Protoporphyrinogen oxidase [Atractiella rhizophila]|nr:Protoporphyrinogen oxidase [Atractiella rhizophila]
MLLKNVARRDCLLGVSARCFTSSATTRGGRPTIGIVGGGLSGLSTAYFLKKSPAFKDASIRIFESSERIGGWINSSSVQLSSGKEVVFESGPRSVRPSGLGGWLGVKMIQDLSLSSQVYTVSKNEPAARNRYIFHDGKLNLLPSSLTTMHRALTSPLLRSLLPSLRSAVFSSRPRSERIEDETVEEFFSRRLSAPVADHLVSAIIGGIYAGDIGRLSAKFIFGDMWASDLGRVKVEEDQETNEKIRAVKGTVEGELRSRMEKASIWGVKGGLEGFPKALERWLKEREVEIHTGASLDAISFDSSSNTWELPNGESVTHLIYAIPLSRISPSLSLSLPHIDSLPSASVSLANLYFSIPFNSLFPRLKPGFGYLIPRSVPTPQNPYGVLGVCFDDFISPSIDDTTPEEGTKVTVIAGGYHYSPAASSSLPLPNTEAEVIQNAIDTLRHHFPHCTIPDPEISKGYIHRNALPQPLVGHLRRMEELKEQVERKGWRGRLAFVAAGVHTGAGVNGAVEGAWRVVNDWENMR